MGKCKEMSLFISSSKSEPFAKDHQIDGEVLKQFQPSKYGNIFVAQVMTRGMVKYRLMYES